ncbi:MAG: hypothetical protein ACI39Q_07695 [Wujia sp.]
MRYICRGIIRACLADNPSVRCKKLYYSYDFELGTFSETSLDEIQLGVARYYEQETKKSLFLLYTTEIRADKEDE